MVTSPSRTVTSASGDDPTTAIGSPSGRRQPQQVHVRTRVGGPQHPVDVQRVGRGRHVEALGQHDLEGVAGPDVLLGDARPWPGSRPSRIRRCTSAGCVPRTPRRAARTARASCALIAVQPANGVVVGVVHPLVGAVPVDRVGDQGDGALVVIERGQVGRQQHHQFGDAELVRPPSAVPASRRGRRRRVDALQPADDVVAEVADHAAGQRRQAGAAARCAAPQRLGQRVQRIAAVGQPVRRRGRARRRRRPARSARPAPSTPTNDQRDQDRPFSADSSRKVPGRSPARVAYRPTGVIASASSRRVTGMTRRSHGQLPELLPARADLAERGAGPGRRRDGGDGHGRHSAGPAPAPRRLRPARGSCDVAQFVWTYRQSWLWLSSSGSPARPGGWSTPCQRCPSSWTGPMPVPLHHQTRERDRVGHLRRRAAGRRRHRERAGTQRAAGCLARHRAPGDRQPGAQGLLVRRRGLGTHVVERVGMVRRLQLSSLHHDLGGAGQEPSTRVLVNDGRAGARRGRRGDAARAAPARAAPAPPAHGALRAAGAAGELPAAAISRRCRPARSRADRPVRRPAPGAACACGSHSSASAPAPARPRNAGCSTNPPRHRC